MIRIEPDWNVKPKQPSNISIPVGIRIEPDWNVKLDIAVILAGPPLH